MTKLPKQQAFKASHGYVANSGFPIYISIVRRFDGKSINALQRRGKR